MVTTQAPPTLDYAGEQSLLLLLVASLLPLANAKQALYIGPNQLLQVGVPWTLIRPTICKVTYRGLPHLHEALTKVKKLEKQVSAYQHEINEIKGTKYSLFDIAGESNAIQKVKHEAS